jgi:dihydroneopterin aldolase
MTQAGTQILTLEGLRFDASLGILDQEKPTPQPIRVDAELNLGTQPLLPRVGRAGAHRQAGNLRRL